MDWGQRHRQPYRLFQHPFAGYLHFCSRLDVGAVDWELAMAKVGLGRAQLFPQPRGLRVHAADRRNVERRLLLHFDAIRL